MLRHAQYCSRKILAANRRGIIIDATIAWKIGTFLAYGLTGTAAYVGYRYYNHYSNQIRMREISPSKLDTNFPLFWVVFLLFFSFSCSQI